MSNFKKHGRNSEERQNLFILGLQEAEEAGFQLSSETWVEFFPVRGLGAGHFGRKKRMVKETKEKKLCSRDSVWNREAVFMRGAEEIRLEGDLRDRS